MAVDIPGGDPIRPSAPRAHRALHRHDQYAVFPGGQEFLLQRLSGEGTTPLIVLLNWRAALR